MIDVTHNADNRRSGHHLVIGVLDVILYELGDDIDLLLLLAENLVIYGDVLCILVGDLCIQGNHLALHEELLDDFSGLDAHLVREILDGDYLRDRDGLDLLLYRLDNLRLDECTLAGLLLVGNLIGSLVGLLCRILVLLTGVPVTLCCLCLLVIEILISEGLSGYRLMCYAVLCRLRSDIDGWCSTCRTSRTEAGTCRTLTRSLLAIAVAEWTAALWTIPASLTITIAERSLLTIAITEGTATLRTIPASLTVTITGGACPLRTITEAAATLWTLCRTCRTLCGRLRLLFLRMLCEGLRGCGCLCSFFRGLPCSLFLCRLPCRLCSRLLGLLTLLDLIELLQRRHTCGSRWQRTTIRAGLPCRLLCLLRLPCALRCRSAELRAQWAIFMICGILRMENNSKLLFLRRISCLRLILTSFPAVHSQIFLVII